MDISKVKQGNTIWACYRDPAIRWKPILIKYFIYSDKTPPPDEFCKIENMTRKLLSNMDPYFHKDFYPTRKKAETAFKRLQNA